MSKYVIPDLKGIDEKVERDLEVIRSSILDIYGDSISSIILCGGFGRGEGSIIEGVPFNDYDIVLISKKRIPKKELKSLGTELAKRIGIRFVDLGVVTDVSKLQLSVFSFDLKNSKVIYGKDVLEKLPTFNSEDISVDEGVKLLRNRIICFLELTPDGFLDQRPINENEHRLLVLQVSKAVIAASIAELILKRRYVSSYNEQKRLQSDSLIIKAYDVKLGLVDPITVDPYKYWIDSIEYFLSVFDNYPQGSTQSNLFRNILKLIILREPFHLESSLRKVEEWAVKIIRSGSDKGKDACIKEWERVHH
ncbi:hypothetical protein COB52_03375 [Candidatus Kaiserbacteria bacterium]|nr:MAG: hypothetical protein COB52_03375 [Candidatus Kaiserbacteria bacterium]